MSKRRRMSMPVGFAPMQMVPFNGGFPGGSSSGSNYSMPIDFPLNMGQQTGTATSYTQTDTQRKNEHSGSGVTSQHDREQVYKYKRMPNKKKQPWVKFLKAHRAANLKELAPTSIIRNDLLTNATTALNQQVYLSAVLYGSAGTPFGSAGDNDLSLIFQELDITPGSSHSYLFDTGVLDTTWTNTSESGTVIELDIYEMAFYKESLTPNLFQAINQAASGSEALPGGGAAGLAMETRGATPFQFPGINQQIGSRVLKKTKYFVSANQCITYQLRDSKNHRFNEMGIVQQTGFVKQGVTKALFGIFKAIAKSPLPIASMAVGVTRTYKCTALKDNAIADGLVI